MSDEMSALLRAVAEKVKGLIAVAASEKTDQGRLAHVLSAGVYYELETRVAAQADPEIAERVEQIQTLVSTLAEMLSREVAAVKAVGPPPGTLLN